MFQAAPMITMQTAIFTGTKQALIDCVPAGGSCFDVTTPSSHRLQSMNLSPSYGEQLLSNSPQVIRVNRDAYLHQRFS